MRTWFGAIAVVAACSAAWGTPYYVEYQGSSGIFPEDCGWDRLTFDGGAQRWFEDGCLVLDSRASIEIVDSYSMQRPGQLDPAAPGEWFFMSWRMRTDELQGPWDATVGVLSDERRGVFLDFSLDGIHIPGQGFVATFEPGVFHDFELRSSDMLTFTLYIDAIAAYEGNFTDPLVTASTVAWGDDTQGGASLTHWERFSFGVVPEPQSALSGVALLVVARAARR